ncbi:MAG: polysaccharide deacetylase family protein [Paracoccaceae bacterium]
MTEPGWLQLDTEIQHWKTAGLRLPLWWRDDDAVGVTPQLERLLLLSGDLGLPVGLAVVPRDAQPALAQSLQGTDAYVLIHGWAHENHAPADQKKAEFGPHRPVEAALDDVSHGMERLRTIFGPKLTPVFVPPWNRITPELLPLLPNVGIETLSTFTPRASRMAAEGLQQMNTHLDPINWRGDRSVVPPAQLFAQLTKDLENRRLGHTDHSEPYGILTHHLVHDEAIWSFTTSLISRLLADIADPCTLEGNRT